MGAFGLSNLRVRIWNLELLSTYACVDFAAFSCCTAPLLENLPGRMFVGFDNNVYVGSRLRILEFRMDQSL